MIVNEVLPAHDADAVTRGVARRRHASAGSTLPTCGRSWQSARPLRNRRRPTASCPISRSLRCAASTRWRTFDVAADHPGDVARRSRSGTEAVEAVHDPREAPELLLTAKTQRWTPEEMLRVLVDFEIVGELSLGGASGGWGGCMRTCARERAPENVRKPVAPACPKRLLEDSRLSSIRSSDDPRRRSCLERKVPTYPSEMVPLPIDGATADLRVSGPRRRRPSRTTPTPFGAHQHDPRGSALGPWPAV